MFHGSSVVNSWQESANRTPMVHSPRDYGTIAFAIPLRQRGKDMPGAVCLTSGGQDSTTCLFWAKQRFDPVLALAFDYGQRHRVELEAAQVVCDLAGVPLTVLPLMILRDLGGSALIGSHTILQTSGGRGGLPNTFVPGRNLLF